jgi:glycosylphosphatidylinositol transamidase
MAVTQATSLPTGAHGVFQKFGIQALTLQTLDQENDAAYLTITVGQLGGVVEGIVRSLNNLLERFNRSFWFYLLPSTRRYVSIGMYMVPFALLLSPLLLRVVQLMFCSSGPANKLEGQSSLWPSICFGFVCHLLGLSLASVPFLIQRWSISPLAHQNPPPNWKTEDVLFYTILCFCISCMNNPLFELPMLRQRKRRQSLTILLLNASLLFGTLSLLNFSLAVLLTFIHVPFLLLVSSQSPTASIASKMFDYIIKGLSLLIHPLSLVLICAAITSWKHDSDDTLIGHLHRSFYGVKRLLLFSIEDWYTHGNWTYPLATTCLFPIWIQLWNLV